MARVTANNIVHAIAALNRNVDYNYISSKSHGLIRIVNITMPAGPIIVRRWEPNKGGSALTAKNVSISSEMIWRVANAISAGEPFNLDRILGASYNTRSLLEALMAYTPEFYYCYPGRIAEINGVTSIEHGHKHLLWRPDTPHANGELVEIEVPNMQVSEIPTRMVIYNDILVPDSLATGGLDIEVVRRHTQIQIALYLIGLQLGYETWIAQNDKGIVYKDKPLYQHPGIISRLGDESMISSFPNAEHSGRLIDCIWFNNQTRPAMPAVMEVEHTTGIISGLARMKGFQDSLPEYRTRYVIVAPDDDRDRAVEAINRPQFQCLDARFFAYSSVEELYYLCTHRNFHNVTPDFMDAYMEKVCTAPSTFAFS